MAITPVVPVADSQLVVDTQAVIIDFDAAPVEVRVDSVPIWNDSVGFAVGTWSGRYITDTGIWRLVCDPPAPFTVGSTHTVYAETGTETLTYGFRVGLEKLTTDGDLSSPQVVKVDTYTWSARAHNNEDPGGLPGGFDGPGNIYLQVLDPRGSEILVVPGREVGLVWDEGRNKVIIYFVRNETVFYAEADPGDTPSTKAFPRSLEATIRVMAGGEGHQEYDDAWYPPIKLPLEQAVGFIGGGEGFYFNTQSPRNEAPTPEIVSGVQSGPPVVIRVQRPTRTVEDELLAGYYLVKYVRDTPSIIGYTAMAPEDDFVEFIDSSITIGCKYAVIPVYHLWTQRHPVLGYATERSYETKVDEPGPKSLALPEYSFRQVVEFIGGGEGLWAYDDAWYPPIKVPFSNTVEAVHGGEGYFYWADSSFDPIGT